MREDWIECSLDEVCDVLDNLRKPINSAERNERIKGKDKSDLFPYYGATGQVGYIDDFLTDGDYVLLGEDAAPFLDYTKDVAYKITGKTWVNNHAHILKSHFNDEFLLHFLNQFQYRDFVTGTTRLKLTQGALKRMPTKLAPLPIQRAIVSKIEALFSDLDNGIANFKKAQEQLKIYRQAVLKKAFEGGFSIMNEELRMTDEKSEESFNHKDHSSDNLPNGWKWVKFEDVLEIISGKNQKQVENPNGKYPIYGSGGVFGKANDYLCEAGTTIIGRKGTIDTPIYVNEKFWNVDTAFGLSPFEKLNNKFLFYFCQSFNFKKLDKSTTIPSLAKRDLLKIDIPFPPSLQEQTQIVQEIESRLSVCDKMEQSINESILKAEALRQSILKKAFEGRLLSQAEIEQCKKEADYEPASELLKKIKAEKLAKEQEKKKPTVKKKSKK